MSHRIRIEALTGRKIKEMRPLSGGMIGEVYRIDFVNGQSFVAKVAKGKNTTLDIESRMITYLSENSELPVPEVIHSEKDLLLMSYIENSGGISHSVQANAAIHLARLHDMKAEKFGLEFDTLIGSLHQPNTLSNSWIDFFREQRLLYMANVARMSGNLSLKLYRRLENFAKNLEKFLVEPDAPSLIHGDIWGGNVLALNGKIAGFVDPAIYYAHSEIELAFSTLFGTFGEAFFDVYQELRPIEPGFFSERRDIYNLYPLLVHVRIFGGGYASQVDSVLSRFSY